VDEWRLERSGGYSGIIEDYAVSMKPRVLTRGESLKRARKGKIE